MVPLSSLLLSMNFTSPIAPRTRGFSKIGSGLMLTDSMPRFCSKSAYSTSSAFVGARIAISFALLPSSFIKASTFLMMYSCSSSFVRHFSTSTCFPNPFVDTGFLSILSSLNEISFAAKSTILTVERLFSISRTSVPFLSPIIAKKSLISSTFASRNPYILWSSSPTINNDLTHLAFLISLMILNCMFDVS